MCQQCNCLQCIEQRALKGVGCNPPKLSIVRDEQQDERTWSIGDFFRQCIIAADLSLDPEIREKARERLTKVYGSKRLAAEGPAENREEL